MKTNITIAVLTAAVSISFIFIYHSVATSLAMLLLTVA